MQITKSSIETMTGPSEWFTGAVYIDTVTTPSGQSRLQASSVHFTPGARTAWHSHEGGQTLYITEGRGIVQARGEDKAGGSCGYLPAHRRVTPAVDCV